MKPKKLLNNKLNHLIRNKKITKDRDKIKEARAIVRLYRDAYNVKKLPPLVLATIALAGFSFRKTVDESAGEKLYFYRSGIYTPVIVFIRNLLDHIDPTFRIRDFPDILKHIQAEAPAVDPDAKDRNVIPCHNGLYYRNNPGIYANFQSFTPDVFIRSKIATDYPDQNRLKRIRSMRIKDLINDKAVHGGLLYETVPAFVEKFFSNITDHDPSTRRLLYQEILDSLEPNFSHGKAVINYGTTGSNGKSNFTQLLLGILGAANVSALKINSLNDKNAFSTLAGKMADVSDDLGDDTFLKDNANFKSLITGGQVYVEKKYHNGYTNRLNIALIQNTNRLPSFNGQGDFIKRRLLIVPFMHHFKPGDHGYIENDTILKILKSRPVREWVLYKALNQPRFTHYSDTKASRRLLDRCMLNNDPVKVFFNDFKRLNIQRIPRQLVYKAWKQYAATNNYKSKNLSNIKFYSRFENVSTYESKRARFSKSHQVKAIRSGLDRLKIVYDPAADLPKLDHSYSCFVLN